LGPRRLIAGLMAGVALVVAGCGGGDGLEGARRASSFGPADRFVALQALEGRVTGVFHRLTTANLELCPTKGRSAGWALHAANQYGAEMRPFAMAQGDLRGDLPAVLALAPGGPAERDGLRVGDVILAVDGERMSIGEEAAPETYSGLAGNLTIADRALSDDGPVLLTLSRGGVPVTVALTPEAACGHRVHLDVSDELNARADGADVFISTALAGFTQSDDELALILAHELAHNILGHRERFDREAPARRVFGNLAVAPGSLAAAEREADRWSLYLMHRAGFDVDVAAPFWRRFGEANWRVRWAQWGHPSAEVRARQLETVAAEIAEAGGPPQSVRPL